MEKIIQIDGIDVKLKSTGAFLLKYKQHFGRDALQDLSKLATIDVENDSMLEGLNIEVMYNLVWTLAHSANKDIPPMIDWVDSFSSFDISKIMQESIDLIVASMGQTVVPKKKI